MFLISSDESIKKQHNIVRNTAGWYYFTHQLIEVTGKNAADLLDYIYTNSIGKAAVGRAKYTTMLNEDGIILDDVVIFRIDENKFWISTLHKPRTLAALQKYKKDWDVEFKSITHGWDMYSVQGPRAKDLVNTIVEDPIDDLKFFAISDNKIGYTPIKVARGGYTGEQWGYEIYVTKDQKNAVEEALSSKEKEFGAMKVDEVDVMAYTLPTEKGFVLVTDIDTCNPFEVQMDKTIDWSKDFIGKSALEVIKGQPLKRKLIGVKVDDKNARVHGGPKGAPIFKDGVNVGKVTKFTYGFTVDSYVGFALIDTELAKVGDKVILNNNTEAVLTERPILQ